MLWRTLGTCQTTWAPTPAAPASCLGRFFYLNCCQVLDLLRSILATYLPASHAQSGALRVLLSSLPGVTQEVGRAGGRAGGRSRADQ